MNDAIAKRVHRLQPDHAQGTGLHVLPILGPSHERPAYELLRPQTLPQVRITEISAAGSVPELQVHNDLDVIVYLMDGQELVGAKQNRILNSDVLVPAKSRLTIPVSCVEAGRWQQVSNQFSAGRSASHRIRSAKAARVHDSLKADQRHDAGQGAVWNEVQASLDHSQTTSPTRALHDAYQQREAELKQFRGDLRLPPEAVGVAVFHGGRFQGLDLFDRHSTLVFFWESLLDSYAIDFLASPLQPGKTPASSESALIAKVLKRATAGEWQAFASPGVGQDWRLEDKSFSGSSLIYDEQVVVHLQVFPKTKQPTPRRPRIHRRYGTPPTSPPVE